jgi:hypothetical protein
MLSQGYFCLPGVPIRVPSKGTYPGGCDSDFLVISWGPAVKMDGDFAVL